MAQDGKRQHLSLQTKDDADHHALTLQIGQQSFGDLIDRLKPHQCRRVKASNSSSRSVSDSWLPK